MLNRNNCLNSRNTKPQKYESYQTAQQMQASMTSVGIVATPLSCRYSGGVFQETPQVRMHCIILDRESDNADEFTSSARATEDHELEMTLQTTHKKLRKQLEYAINAEIAEIQVTSDNQRRQPQHNKIFSRKDQPSKAKKSHQFKRDVSKQTKHSSGTRPKSTKTTQSRQRSRPQQRSKSREQNHQSFLWEPKEPCEKVVNLQ